jgi:hypothetical protein
VEIIHIVCGFFQRKVAGRPDKTHEVRCTLPADRFFQLKDGTVWARCAKHDANMIRQSRGTDPDWIPSISREEFIIGEIMQS